MDPESGRKAIELAAEILRRGGLVVIPTETVYGIGADALNGQAVADIFRAKGRPQDNPLIVHIARLEDWDRLVRRVPQAARTLAERFWPGPLTVILEKSGLIPGEVSAGLSTVAVRMPAHPVALEIIRRSGSPVAAPSANLSGRPSPTSAAHCMADLQGRVDLVVDGGDCPVGVESTVVTLAGPRPRLLRPGGVTLEQLREALGDVEADPAVLGQADPAKPASSPGMKYRHYAPKAEVILVHGSFQAFSRYVGERGGDGVFALVFDDDGELEIPCLRYGGRMDHREQARRLFDALRRLDDRGARTVYARCPDPKGVGLAVFNRLIRAAAFREVRL